MMAQIRAESTWEINNYGKYINQFPSNIIKSIRQYERINKKMCRQKVSIIFNEIFIKKFVGNGHGDTNSNPGRDWLHFT